VSQENRKSWRCPQSRYRLAFGGEGTPHDDLQWNGKRAGQAMSAASPNDSRAKTPLPVGYRQGIISAITVLLGFSLLFLRYWTFEAPGEWTVGTIIAALLLAVAVLLELFALWRSLRLEDDEVGEYRKTLNWFMVSACVLLVSVLLAALTYSHAL
jgi:uncharacterized membrane protein YidH (DUF202 family)